MAAATVSRDRASLEAEAELEAVSERKTCLGLTFSEGR
jgi:hypothetical protein